jgi:hypothetical protein
VAPRSTASPVAKQLVIDAAPKVIEFCYDGVVYLWADKGIAAKINKDRQGPYSTYVNCQ